MGLVKFKTRKGLDIERDFGDTSAHLSLSDLVNNTVPSGGDLWRDENGELAFYNGTLKRALGRLPISTSTMTETLVTGRSGSVITNDGATGDPSGRVITLPPAEAGLSFEFVSSDVDRMRISANAGDTIRLTSVVTVSGGYVENEGIGDAIRLICIDETSWIATHFTGNWTVQTS